MNRIKFIRDEGTLFYRELNQRVNAYFAERKLPKHGGSKMKVKMTFYFGLNVLTYLLMIFSPSPGVFMLSYLLMGLSILLTAFNISHDASHGVAVASKFWNKVLFSLSFNLQGNNAYVWGRNHQDSHHSFTNIEGSDIDVLNNPLFRMTKSQTLRWYHRFQFLYAPVLYLLYSLNWFLFRDTLMLFRLSSRTIHITLPIEEAIKLVFFKLFYVAYMIALPIYLLPFGAGWVLLAFLMNHAMVSLLFVAVLGVSHLSDHVEHPVVNEQNEVPMSWPMLQMKTSVDYNSDSPFLNAVLGGFNAHALHHLLPHVSHVHYLEILPIFRETCKKHGIEYKEMNYLDSLKAHFRFLRLMGKPAAIAH
ncbi:MAG: acyl-CoA desaturase [Bacteroidota bacterium]|nr:acyl-CoA desaturase [Bacteroidota bacterium]MDX5430634.1 acyl-CoA desaturase [Bacteroidota bacterium]MDX5469384.1 acyl-CoA desaturase [Bacteroidota bacterium]